MGDRIMVMNFGEIQQVGTPEEVFNHPANLFVAGFIGMPSMNLLEGRLRSVDGRRELAGPGFAFPIDTPLPDGTELVAGVRPQALQLAEGAGCLALQVDVVEYLGTESLLIGRLEGGGSERVTAVLSGQRSDLLRRTVALANEPQALHVFDKATGQRVSA